MKSMKQMCISREPRLKLKHVRFGDRHKDIFPLEAPETRWYGFARVALYDGIRLLGLGANDTILVPEYICNVIMAPIHALGLNVQFYPIGNGLRPDWKAVSRLITSKTKALILVNYFGFSNDWDTARKIADEYGLRLIEDNAHGFLSYDNKKPLGSNGDVSIFSFHKTLPIPDGAALIVNRKSVIRGNIDKAVSQRRGKSLIRCLLRAGLISIGNGTFCDRTEVESLSTISATTEDLAQEYDFDRFRTRISSFSRWIINNLDLDMEQNQRRQMFGQWLRFIQDYFQEECKPLYTELPKGIVPYVFPVLVENRDDFIVRLRRHGVEAFPWPFLPKGSSESYYSNRLVCIPVTSYHEIKSLFGHTRSRLAKNCGYEARNSAVERLPRVALVCVSVNEMGGKSEHMKNLYLSLRREGFEVCLIVCAKIRLELENFMIRHGVVRDDLIFMSRIKKWLIVPAILELHSIFRKRNIDLVHSFQIESDIFSAPAAEISNVTDLFSTMESKAIPENISGLKKILYRGINAIIRKRFLCTLAVSKGLKREIIDQKIRPDGRVEILHVGLPIPQSVYGNGPSVERLRAGTPVIGSIGRFSYEKALDRIIEAAPYVLRAVPGASFVLIGGGPELSRLKQTARDCGVFEKFEFKPWVEDIYAELDKIDIFVMPSKREGCPQALLQALAASKSVVASRIEGIADIIDHDVEGLLIDTADPATLAKGIVDLCRSPELALRLGERGCRRVHESFTIQGEVERLKNIYLNKGASAKAKLSLVIK